MSTEFEKNNKVVHVKYVFNLCYPNKLNFKNLERAIKLHVKTLQCIRYRREKNKKLHMPNNYNYESKYTNIWPGLKGNMQK